MACSVGYYGGEYVGMEYGKLEQHHMHLNVLKSVQYRTRIFDEYK